ncbi:Fic family protein [Leptospira jelokensis]|uniref:Fic family protein n=1 Tax=Leptospira jelokensis TaxID=2484931 RepID=UPI00109121E3|nr:Fic family protein [Leptospira jelokensis]TGL99931.1 Fic family protein [Leptospira jelokensis]
MDQTPINILNTPYHYFPSQKTELANIAARVTGLRSLGKLNHESLQRIRAYFKIKNIYNSNAIEGNELTIGETREVIERGLTITGKSLKDQAEAKNLSEALDFLEEIAKDSSRPIIEQDIKQIHYFILKKIRDEEAGKYRSIEVEISGSQFRPSTVPNVPVEMELFSNWLQKVTSLQNVGDENAIIYAAVAHTWFVTIHPFIDGNGRTARLLMNLILMRFGYPIAVITKEDRFRYYDTLEISQSSDLSAFIALLIECIYESLEEYEEAVKRQQEQQEWAKALANRFDQKEQIKVKNKFEIWRSAMDLLKNTFKNAASIINDNTNFSRIYFSDFGELDYEKYLSLSTGESAKKTWFFRIDFKQNNISIRYLFFFSNPSYHAKSRNLEVTLSISREEPQGSFNYSKLEFLQKNNVPSTFELGYSISDEKFLLRQENNSFVHDKIEAIAQLFFEEVMKKHFNG